MKRAACIIAVLCVAARGGAADAPATPYAALAKRAVHRTAEVEQPRVLIRRFERLTSSLDSLLASYSPLDTLSWSIGLGRVAAIARCYNALDLPAEALTWWKLLARNDTRGVYARDAYGGILRSAASPFDSTALAGVINRAAHWDDSLVRSLGPELAGAFTALREHCADSTWLAERFENVRMLLPAVEAALFEADLLGARGEWQTAHDRVARAAAAADVRDGATARRLIEALYRTALWGGRFTDARAVLDAMAASGDEAFARKAGARRVDIELLEGRLLVAETEYQTLCRGSRDDAPCFWQTLLARYREVTARVRERI